MSKNYDKFVLKSDVSIALISGAMAGMCVDLTLFPIDTIKTRIQSDCGFWKSGGFKRIYSGLTSTIVGSAPNAALFFCAYETSKDFLKPLGSEKYEPMVHMLSASIGEVTACLVRVPTEVVKQRAQASKVSTGVAFRSAVSNVGFKGLYRGYLSTIVREIPFAFIQFPVWELLKKNWSLRTGMPIKLWQSTVSGAVAGGLAAFITTPLDLAKTRIMLSQKRSVFSIKDIYFVLKSVYIKNGFLGLFSGGVPRVCYISLGGAIFLGGYDTISSIIRNL